MDRFLGNPCWYELTTTTGQLGAAEAFYGDVLGWVAVDSGMEGFTYHLARAGEAMVAGLMEPMPGMAGSGPVWMVYFAVDDGDVSVETIRREGGEVHRELTTIPGTGRFAICSDPQGAAFGILEPEPMPEGTPFIPAFDMKRPGHGAWHELMTTDPAGALGFYSAVFDWTAGRAMEMGAEGVYQIFAREGVDIGGMMGLGQAPAPAWLPYFGVSRIDAAKRRVEAGGGAVVHGPAEVPGGAFILVCTDPQGAAFAVIGPK